MIVLLDFDGVLHPQYEGQSVPVNVAFCHRAQFEAVMREFPQVEIVISSTWREQFSLDELRAWFSADIAARIIDTIELQKRIAPPRMVALREWEIVTWLMGPGRQDEPWIALDDAAWQFKPPRPPWGLHGVCGLRCGCRVEAQSCDGQVLKLLSIWNSCLRNAGWDLGPLNV